MERAPDALVAGAGLVGLATARALAARGLGVLVLEREQEVATHQSGRNSGVLHSGLQYRAGTLKARLCGEGRRALLAYMAERGLPHRVAGKVVVATSVKQVPRLRDLEERGRANGLEAIERLDAKGLAAVEPWARGLEALWVPETGVADFGAVARALAADLRGSGGKVERGRALLVARRERGRWICGTSGGPVEGPLLVNAGGLWADRLARACGVRAQAEIVPFRGTWRRLRRARAHLVKTSIYPVPDPSLPFLGTHFTRGVDGEVDAGPNAVWALARDGYSAWRVSLRDTAAALAHRGFRALAHRHWRTAAWEVWKGMSLGVWLAEARKLLPVLRAGDLGPRRSGVRAQAVYPNGDMADDFVLERREGAVHVISAPSPAATACLAIGEEIARSLLDGSTLWKEASTPAE